MWLCDYINDLGVLYRRVRPRIRGVELMTGEVIDTATVLLRISNYLAIDGYYEVGNREAVCQLRGRARKVRLQIRNDWFELDYYMPFTDLDWSLYEGEGIKVETTPEYINQGDMEVMLLKLR